MTRAAFFDMDRTLVRVDTATLYMRWQFRCGLARRRDLARVSWWLLQYTLGRADVDAIARLASRPLAGRSEREYAALLEEWVRTDVLPHVADKGRAEVEKRQRAGEHCVLLTGSSPYAAEPVARALGIDHVLCSRLGVRDGVFTGEPVLPLCYGVGKVRSAEAWAVDHGVDLAASAFYSDSISDLPMLERVGEPVVVNPDPRLRVIAALRRWPVLRW